MDKQFLVQAVTEVIKKELCDLQVTMFHKQVEMKTGYEEVFCTIFLKQQEFVFAQHVYSEPKIKTPEEIANEIFLKPLKTALNNALEYNSLKKSWWKRVKFIFNL